MLFDRNLGPLGPRGGQDLDRFPLAGENGDHCEDCEEYSGHTVNADEDGAEDEYEEDEKYRPHNAANVENHPEALTLYRGLHFGEGSDEDIEHLHRDPVGYMATNVLRPERVGIHWTQDYDSAHRFATGRDIEGNFLEEYGDEDEPRGRDHGVVLEAKVHPRHVIDPDSEEGEAYQMSDAILPGSAEAEDTVRAGSRVHVHKIHAVSTPADDDRSPWDRVTTHEVRQHHLAAFSTTAALGMGALEDWDDSYNPKQARRYLALAARVSSDGYDPTHGGKGMSCIYCGAKDRPLDEKCPSTRGTARHTLISYTDKTWQGQGYGPGPEQNDEDYTPNTLGWDGKDKRVVSRRNGSSQISRTAHGFDPTDDQVVRSCPFCGSGNVWGGSDGVITCEFDGARFTVTVEPQYSTMPQFAPDGTPYNMDGSLQSGPPGGPPDMEVGDPGMLSDDPDGQDPSQDPSQDPTAGLPEEGSPADEEEARNGSSFQASLQAASSRSPKFYLSHVGEVLDEDRFLSYIASRFAESDTPESSGVR